MIAPLHQRSLPSCCDRSPHQQSLCLTCDRSSQGPHWRSLLSTGYIYPSPWPEIAPLPPRPLNFHLRLLPSTSYRSNPPAIAPLTRYCSPPPAIAPLQLRLGPWTGAWPAIAPISSRQAGPRMMANSEILSSYLLSSKKSFGLLKPKPNVFPCLFCVGRKREV